MKMNSAEHRNEIICYVIVFLNILVTAAVFHFHKEIWLSFIGFILFLFFVRSPDKVEKPTPKDRVMLVITFVVILSLFLWGLLSAVQYHAANMNMFAGSSFRSIFSFTMLSSFAVILSQTTRVNDGVTSCLYQYAFFPLTINVVALLNSAPEKSIPYITLLGVLNILVFFVFLYVGSPSFRNPHSRFSKIMPALKMIALSSILSLSIAVPVSALRQSMRDMDLPSIGDFPAISTSNEIVFKAVFTSAAVPQKPYWIFYPAQYVFPLGEYEWDTWSTLQKKQNVTGLLSENKSATRLVSLNQGEYTYSQLGGNDRFYLEGSYDFNYVPTTISSQKNKSSPEPGGFIRVNAFVDYQNEQANGLTEGLKVVYLSIPSTPYIPTTVDMSGAAKNMPKTYDLVRQWRSEGLTDQQFIDRTLTYFSENMAYNFDYQSMDPDKNRVDYFVFEEKRGVCRHFANTFAMMMRMGGIPSRLVGGFAGGEYNSADNSWSVRKRDAHVWTEVWLEGKGWVKVDPTLAVRVEKAVPDTQVGVMASWFNQWSGAFSKFNWSETFSTTGTSNENNYSNGTPSLLDGVDFTLFKWLIAVVCSGVIGVFLFLVSRHKRNKKQPEDIAWDKLKVKLKRMGYLLNENAGPYTIGELVVEDLEPAIKSEWLKLIDDYQRWKFGDEIIPDLAKRINWIRRNIKIKSK